MGVTQRRYNWGPYKAGDKIAGPTGLAQRPLFDSRDTLVLEHAYDDLAVLRLISRAGALLRLTLAHRAGGKHSCQRHMALLKED